MILSDYVTVRRALKTAVKHLEIMAKRGDKLAEQDRNTLAKMYNSMGERSPLNMQESQSEDKTP